MIEYSLYVLKSSSLSDSAIISSRLFMSNRDLSSLASIS